MGCLKELRKRGTSERILKALENELAFLERSVWEKSLKHAVEELLVKKNIKSPIEVFQVGKIGELLKQEIEKAGGITLEEAGIVMDKHAMLHIREERKGAYGQALRIEEILKIPEVLQRAESVSYEEDRKRREHYIIFWFDDNANEKMINKLVVNLNRKIKKFGVSNYTVTMGKINKETAGSVKFITP